MYVKAAKFTDGFRKALWPTRLKAKYSNFHYSNKSVVLKHKFWVVSIKMQITIPYQKFVHYSPKQLLSGWLLAGDRAEAREDRIS